MKRASQSKPPRKAATTAKAPTAEIVRHAPVNVEELKNVTPAAASAPGWVSVEVDVDKLTPYERNPRRITKEEYDRLKAAISKVGFHTPLIINQKYQLISGHQRIRALKELGIKKVACRMPDRAITAAEFKQILIQSNLQNGTFNFDMLADDFEVTDLTTWGVPAKWLGDVEVPKFEAVSFNAQSSVDKSNVKTCPSCGHEWED